MGWDGKSCCCALNRNTEMRYRIGDVGRGGDVGGEVGVDGTVGGGWGF